MKKRGIIVALILMSIGFATVATTLIINGNIKLGFDANDFEIYFSDAYLDSEQHKEFISQDGKSITYNSNSLSRINQESQLKYIITNNSRQYDAEVSVECTPTEDEYITVSNSLNNETITAQSEKEGILSVTLKKSTLEDITKEIKCNLTVNAVEKVEVAPEREIAMYSLGGYLINQEGKPVANGRILVYSDEPKETTTDELGYFYIEGLDRGKHEVYYVSDEVDTTNKENVKSEAIASGEITTSNQEIKLSNGYEIKDPITGKTEELIHVTLGTTEEKVKPVKKGGSAVFTLSKEEIGTSTHLYANNGVTLKYADNTLTISDVKEDTHINLGNVIYDTISNLDTTNNYIIMLKDEELLKQIDVAKEKKLTFDLNGKHVYSNTITENGMIRNYGKLKIVDNTGNGILEYSKNGNVVENLLGTLYIGNVTLYNSFENDSKNVVYQSDGSLEIDGTTFKSQVTNKGSAIYTEGGTVNFKNGTLKAGTISGLNLGGSTTAVIDNGYFETSNIAINLRDSKAILTINNIEVHHTDDSNSAIYNNGGKITINNGKFIDQSAAIKNDNSGVVDINNAYLESNFSKYEYLGAIYNNNNGKINIHADQTKECSSYEDYTGGVCILSNIYGIVNCRNAAINMSNTYIKSSEHAIANSLGTINIYSGSYISTGEVNLLPESVTDKKLYAQAIVQENFVGGLINIYDGYFESKTGCAIRLWINGHININNAHIKSKDQVALWLFSGRAAAATSEQDPASIKICNATIETDGDDLSETHGTDFAGPYGNIYYSDKVIFKSGNNVPQISGTNITGNYTGTCAP